MTSPAVQRTTSPQLSVIMPAFKCADMLRRALDGLLASDLPRADWELIVVDDGSPDSTPDVARTAADLVLVTPNGPRGPGFARNLGAARARGGVLVFVDSDVIVKPDVLSRFVALFRAQQDVGAAFGAYDTEPGDPGFLSQYRNLLHHYVHTVNAGDAETFWAGCGAVRRDLFLSIGGYDAVRYPRPQIEDIELGYRIGAAGHRIVLDPRIQGKHLKRWTFKGMARTDLFDRAIPWMHVLMERGEAANSGPLNLKWVEKALTGLTGLALFALLPFLWSFNVAWLWLSLAFAMLVVLGNLRMFTWFARTRGPLFALGVVPFRFLFYLESGVGAAWAIATHRFKPLPAPVAPIRPSSDRAVA